MNLFGNKGALIGSLDLFIAAILVLGAFIFRKSVANDLIDRPFSIIGSCVPGVIGFIISHHIFSSLKFPIVIGIFLWLVGGFLLGDLIGDGNAGGSN